MTHQRLKELLEQVREADDVMKRSLRVLKRAQEENRAATEECQQATSELVAYLKEGKGDDAPADDYKAVFPIVYAGHVYSLTLCESLPVVEKALVLDDDEEKESGELTYSRK